MGTYLEIPVKQVLLSSPSSCVPLLDKNCPFHYEAQSTFSAGWASRELEARVRQERFAIKRLNLPSEFYPEILFWCHLKVWMLPCKKWAKGKKTLSQQWFKMAILDKHKIHQPLYERKDRLTNKFSWMSLFKQWEKAKKVLSWQIFFCHCIRWVVSLDFLLTVSDFLLPGGAAHDGTDTISL